ncbi:MAG: lamin tail domain-containing protein, partial [Bacteroidales bacterium]
ARSTFFPPGAFYFTEVCYFKTTTGAPAGGWPTYLLTDDYIEITGVPNSDLAGHVLEAWNASSLINTYTFPAGTIIGPNGTAIIAIGQPGSSVPVPASYYYHADVSYTHSSSNTSGHALKDGSGNVVDAVGYNNFTFPAASNVTAADWSLPNTSSPGSTSGIRLIGPDNNTGSNWVVSSATYPQDPQTVNGGVTVPTPQTLTGFTWSTGGVVTSTNVIDTVVGPWATSGLYQYIANFVTPCGTLADTVNVYVAIATITGDSAICEGDTAMIVVDLPGTGPWTIVGSDGSGVDTFTVNVSPWISYEAPSATTTYTLIAFADSMNMFYDANISHTVTVIPAPSVTMGVFSAMCASDPSFTLTGGLPTGGIYGGPGVVAGVFDPWTAGPGSHMITYTYTDPTTGCAGTAAEPIVLGAGPAITATADHGICAGESTLLEVMTGGSVQTSLIFSEYIEGSSNNKAIEIFNATPDTLDLDNYRIGQAVNGGGWAYWHYFPTGTKLAPHHTWVMVANQVSSTYYDTANADEVLSYPSVVHHNGDDARSVEVTADGGVTWTIIDIIGDPDNDPGTGWPVAGINNATADKTLIRKPEITHGNTDWLLVAGTDSLSAEYTVYPVNTFTNIGSHTYNAPAPVTVSYAWSTGDTISSITVTPSVTTTYTVTVTDLVTMCGTIEEIVVTVNPLPVVNLGNDFNVCDDGTATIDAGAGFASYLWSTGASTQTITVSGATIGTNNTVAYTVTVTDANGCEGTGVVNVTAIDCSGIDDPNAGNVLTFWPNPSDGNFFVKIKGITGDASLKVINSTGQAISNELITIDGELVKEFNLGNLAPGIYFVRLITETDVITKPVIIK